MTTLFDYYSIIILLFFAGYKMTIKIAITQFKSHCLAIIEKLQTDKESIITTKSDREVAQILPINTKKSHYSVC
ncbi:antitoxin of toxin-antitoxin system Phd [Rickettsia montanensis str. OSU 85-930]|uniref:Antitoxin of toxin-antitoxin system Phd n=2 Tax=Rickettsia montanensis TaxID=33991 RepID=H8KA96_RICMS|nr:antitoxin of toxin-antitoxin system Phd [Rickettsia montanensis str. OSU 85-930]